VSVPDLVPWEAPVATVKSDAIRTASWRNLRPALERAKCTRCAVCWKFCPDVAVSFDPEGFPLFSADHCKGCGICAQECPPGALTMAQEED
jgi:pyruvate ferredoxin oxidoreductase delta subunit